MESNSSKSQTNLPNLEDPEQLQEIELGAKANNNNTNKTNNLNNRNNLDTANNPQLDEIDYDNDTWDVIKSYFDSNKYYLTKHHIESYNDFILNKIPQTFAQYNPQTLFKEFSEELDQYKYSIKIFYGGKSGNEIFIEKPIISQKETKKQMYPNEARLRNLSYSSHIFCNIDIEYTILDDEGVANKINKKGPERVNPEKFQR